ncbi:mitochondrial 54S ribosomal protein YmL36 [Sugiyamaella lignohabitans]|uniref:Mitochondrial 54S ribosomal protein YmL36 n=1 Tax=Sugiyamaella lignohabitans TaxID=796027 RepID=A0A167CH40_9ASCO|nr:mitochondrial 54S ribosomal protein YmL36 [Sugiyamaella lignohabitans]ANB11686.1 mitochondrial 54S ribosomal protein YmL36 [Sugiyamaella lignohabitans]
MSRLLINPSLRPLVNSSNNAVARPAVHMAQSRTVYVPPGGKSVLPKRALRKLLPGKMRPHIYYKFDCVVELSDGSTITRRSQFPKVEWRYIADQRNNPTWNPSKANIKAVEADATGRLAKFKKKFGDFDSLASGTSAEAKTTKAPANDSTSTSAENTASTSSSSADDFLDLLSENVVPVQTGGRLSSSIKKTKKKK